MSNLIKLFLLAYENFTYVPVFEEFYNALNRNNIPGGYFR